jgi:hypothetical protein
MKILFDQATPVPNRGFPRGHLVRTAAQQGWDKLRNGDLLSVAEQDNFDLILTTDRNMGYQQILKDRKIAIVVIDVQQWPKLRPHVQAVVDAINAAMPGSYTEVRIALTK